MENLHQSYCPDCLALYPSADGFCPFHGIPLIHLERLSDQSGLILDNRYRLVSAMPRHGKYGRSYEAEQLAGAKKVLVKIFDPMISRDPVVMKRFNRLVTRQLAFKGTGYIRVLDFGLTPTGNLYRVSEWVEGRDLRTVLKGEGPPNPRVALAWLLDLCKTVEELHAEGILHLSIKPSNVMIVYSEGAWGALLGEAGDGGLLLDEDGREYSKLGLSSLESCYVSPEQAAGKSRDVYTDVYALGVLLLEVLSGHEPFKASCPVDLFKRRLRGGDDWKETLPFDSLPPRLTRTLELALEPHPAKRLQSASVLRAELEMVLKREGPILADLVRNTKPEDELRAVAPVALAEEVLEDVGVQAPLAKQDPEELKRIWAELDLDAKAILVAQRKRGMLASAVGVALLVAVLVVFFQDIVTGARRILGAEDEERVLNIAAEQRGGGRRGDQGAEVDLAAARKAALDQLANKDLPGLGSDEANIQGDLGPRVPATQGLEAGVDKGALARKMEQALGGADRSGGRPANPNEPVSLRLGAAAAAAAAAGGATGSVGAPGLAPSGSPAAGGQGAAQALGQAAPAGSSGDQGGASPAPKPKGKSAEELSREAMNEDDFELARMAMDFGKKQMKRGQYQLAVENFKNARRMGWHQQTVDGLIADCQRLEKEMEGALAQGQALMRQKRWKDAIPHLKRAQKLGDDSNTTNNLIMECEDYLQQADKAAQGGAVVQ